jgi:biopolymer transport protein ExbB/TolQ
MPTNWPDFYYLLLGGSVAALCFFVRYLFKDIVDSVKELQEDVAQVTIKLDSKADRSEVTAAKESAQAGINELRRVEIQGLNDRARQDLQANRDALSALSDRFSDKLEILINAFKRG